MATVRITALIACLALVLGAGTLSAQTVNVSTNIATSTTWTANNVYNLTQQIYVLPGATLTIEAGTVIASAATANGSGSLAVTKGAQIFVQGTAENPVVMTSDADRATWTNNDPKTGTWRAAANEWGNLTIMGDAYISEDFTVGNVPTPSASNVAAMEGLIAAFPGDTKVLYGGGNDDDDSGSISYLSIRYGGRVVGLNNELNGLSLGGIGRGTDIHHIEIMNNVDDGIEIWGGTFGLKHFAIWNIGDDSLDIDQGFRGKVQFGLIVQGYSLNASQGSGVGDNCIETDGAENSDWQPVTTTTMYNLTVIGQPVDGDGATTWRDNARVQYRNCIFMDCGEKVVRFDNLDGDGALGYGHNGTLSWAQTWTTPYTATSTVNAAANPAALYTVQTSGNLAEIKDSVLFNNADYNEFNNVGANAAACNNVIEPANSPISSIVRGSPTVQGGKVMVPVTWLDPTPANDALTSVAAAPNDGFFTPANYRGAFAPGVNWLCGWTAAEAFGFTGTPASPVAGAGQPGVAGAALMDINYAKNANCNPVGTAGDLNGPFYTVVESGDALTLTINGEPNSVIWFVLGSELNPRLWNLGAATGLASGWVDVGTLPAGSPIPLVEFVAIGDQPGFLNQLFRTDATGNFSLTFPNNFAPGTVLHFQSVLHNSTSLFRTSNSVTTYID